MKDGRLRVIIHRRTAQGKLTSYFHTFKHGTYHLVTNEAFGPAKMGRLALADAVDAEVFMDSTQMELHGPVYKMDLLINTGDDTIKLVSRHIHYLEE